METSLATDEVSETATKHAEKRSARTKKPNYSLIHADPLPLQIYPLPPLLPHNPLNVIYIIFSYFLGRWTKHSHTQPLYHGLLSESSQSVNISDPTSVQDLWNRGFFGKGNLSRSEPTWLIRTHRKYGLIKYDENLTAEELTERRRTERREFKKERARKEQDRLKMQLVQEGKLSKELVLETNDTDHNEDANLVPIQSEATLSAEVLDAEVANQSQTITTICEIEYLQLTLEEAFFLSYALGVLAVIDERTKCVLTNYQLLESCCEFSTIPQASSSIRQPDNPFILSYIAYHHYRSLGWVVKSGTKFTVNFLLYNRGPAFSHAEFAVIVLPSYTHVGWATLGRTTPQWDWMHCVNRVCSQVKKTVLLCYVEVPPLQVVAGISNVSSLLKEYHIREIGIRRWLPSRNRD